MTGDVTPAGNKNAALPLLAAVLLTEGEVVLRNVPRIGDVGTMLQLLSDMGVSVDQQGTTVRLCAKTRRPGTCAPSCSSRSAARCCWRGRCWPASGRPSCPIPGGDRIGRRRVDTHIMALEALGAKCEFNNKTSR